MPDASQPNKRLELLEKHYFHELDRKKSLESSFGLPTGLVAGLFGLVGYHLTQFNYGLFGKAASLIDLAFLISTFGAFLLLSYATYWCARAVMGSAYEHLPDASVVSDYWRELESWHRANSPSEGMVGAVEADFEEYLSDALSRCCQTNWKTNHHRSEELYRAKRGVIWSLIAVAIQSLCHYINYFLGSNLFW